MTEPLTTSGHPYRHAWRNVIAYNIRINWAAGVPTVSKDNAGLIAGIVDDGTGKCTITFDNIIEEVYVKGCEIVGAPGDGDHADVLARTEGGSSGATLQVGTYSEGGGGYQDLACDIDLSFDLYRSAADV